MTFGGEDSNLTILSKGVCFHYTIAHAEFMPKPRSMSIGHDRELPYVSCVEKLSK